MATQQTITKLAKNLNINRIYACHVYHIADKKQLFEDETLDERRRRMDSEGE